MQLSEITCTIWAHTNQLPVITVHIQINVCKNKPREAERMKRREQIKDEKTKHLRENNERNTTQKISFSFAMMIY